MPPWFPPDSCDELDALFLAEPPPPAYYPVLLGTALFTVFCLLTLFTIVSWWLLRDEPRLSRGRSFAVCVFTSIGLLFTTVSDALRWALWDPARNASALPCWLVALSLLSGVGVIAVAACLRFYQLYSWTLYNSLVKNTARRDVSDTESPYASMSSSADAPVTLMSRFAGLRAVLRQSSPRAIATDERQGEEMKKIQTVGLSLSDWSLFVLGTVFFLPNVIIVVAFFASEPAYQSCTGCIFFAPLLIAALVQTALPSGFILYMVVLTYKAPPDLYGIKTELFVWFNIVPGVYMALLLVDLIDPNSLQRTNQVSFDSLTHVATFLQYILWHVWPVVMAFRDRRQRSSLVSHEGSKRGVSMGDLLSGLTDALDDAEFESLCEKLYVSELLRFAQETKSFFQLFFNRSEAWRKAKAQSIVDRFIREQSPMQINISHALRSEVEAKVKLFEQAGGAGQHAIFAASQREALLLLVDAYKVYAAEKKRTKAARESAPIVAPAPLLS